MGETSFDAIGPQDRAAKEAIPCDYRHSRFAWEGTHEEARGTLHVDAFEERRDELKELLGYGGAEAVTLWRWEREVARITGLKDKTLVAPDGTVEVSTNPQPGEKKTVSFTIPDVTGKVAKGQHDSGS
jgi:hypothetical protein